MVKCGKAMKELAEDFKAIWKKDRGLLWWMIINFALNLWMFLLPLTNLNPNKPKIWAQYSDISKGYLQNNWWYLISFSVLAITIGIGHNLIGARLYSKRGRDVSRLFLGVSIAITLVGLYFLLRIIGEN